MTLALNVTDPANSAIEYTIDWGDGSQPTVGTIQGENNTFSSLNVEHVYQAGPQNGPFVGGSSVSGLDIRGDWIEFADPLLSEEGIKSLDWTFQIPFDDIETVHLFASTKNKGAGLFPWDEYVENPNAPGVEFWGTEKFLMPIPID